MKTLTEMHRCNPLALLTIFLAMTFSSVWSRPAEASAHTGGQSVQLRAGEYARTRVWVEPGEGLVARFTPAGSSTGSTRIEAYVGGSRLARVSGSRDEVVKWAFPTLIAIDRMQIELRYICRTKTCFGSISWLVNTNSHSPKPPEAIYLNQRSFREQSGVCKDAQGRTIYDGACMCSDTSAGMALVLAGGIRQSESRLIAREIWDSTVDARRPHGGAQVVGALLDAMEDAGDASCYETRISQSSFDQNLRNGVRMGNAVLLRSKGFSTPGHYVTVVGFKQNGNELDLMVNDPMGQWLKLNSWKLNSTSEQSTVGQGLTYRLSSLGSDTSAIICVP